MLSEAVPQLRIYTPEPTPLPPSELATRELLRPAVDRGNGRDLEPLSRAWFEVIENKRYTNTGAWLPHVLEFSRHPDDSLLMIGPGLGTDALRYLQYHVNVTMAALPGDATDAIARNFSFRGLEPRFVPILTPDKLPIPDRSFDLAYLNVLHRETTDLAAIVRELYRILKPGGKLFALLPARYDVEQWQAWLLPFRQLRTTIANTITGTKFPARELRSICGEFEDVTIQKRHLRRLELPPIWRLVPLSLAERIGGRVLALRAKKPISTGQLRAVA